MTSSVSKAFYVLRNMFRPAFPDFKLFIRMEFDGSGDSGDIHSVYYCKLLPPANDFEIHDLWGSDGLEDIQGPQEMEWNTMLVLPPPSRSVLDACKDFGHDLISKHVGSYGNDAGGFGDLVIRLDTGEYYINLERRYESTEHESHAGKLRVPITHNV